jgi:hypothetical protein
MHFVSYYYDKDPSKSNYYENCASELAKQLNSYGYKYSFNYINFDQQGLNSSYLKLNMIKPSFILQKMEELNDGIIWIDADCAVLSRIDEFETLNDDFDLAYSIREHDGINPHAALLYFNKTENSIKFLKEWESINKIKVNDPTYDCSEHCTLIDLLKENPESTVRKSSTPLRIVKFQNLAKTGDYRLSKFGNSMNGVKVWIGISPAAWEYERARTS